MGYRDGTLYSESISHNDSGRTRREIVCCSFYSKCLSHWVVCNQPHDVAVIRGINRLFEDKARLAYTYIQCMHNNARKLAHSSLYPTCS